MLGRVRGSSPRCGGRHERPVLHLPPCGAAALCRVRGVSLWSVCADGERAVAVWDLRVAADVWRWTVMQLSLVSARTPVAPSGIDLRCCDAAEMLASLTEEAHLVVADPPWSYSQSNGASRADSHYGCLSIEQIAAHLSLAAKKAPRLALWITGALVAEWDAQHTPWGRPVTEGAWVKSGEGDSGHYGQGYHWAGCAEFVRVYTRGGCHTDRAVPLRNAWVEPPGGHSEKPVEWQAQWIRRWVPPGGLVVDVYAGLGSVARATLLAGEGRRYVGAELSPERHSAALSLLAQMRGGR